MKKLSFALCLLALHHPQLAAEAGAPIRPLAQQHVVVAESPSPMTTPLNSPAIITLPDGRLVASYTSDKRKGRSGTACQVMLTSDDHGKTWVERARSPARQGRLFLARNTLYYIATGAGLPIQKSADRGETWSAVSHLTDKKLAWYQTAANTWRANGSIYLVMERRKTRIEAWNVIERMPILMRAKETADLLDPKSWTHASELAFADALPGSRENDPATGFFGIPFYPQTYPNRNPITSKRSFSPAGWLEFHVVQITDPDHYWHDPSGRTFHLFGRAHTGGTGYAAVCKVVENSDGTMTTSLEKVPSGKTILFLPFPGGQMRFHVLYDAKTKLYWLLSTQATDSMTRADRLAPDRYDLAFSERQRLVLHYSKNMIDWCFAGLVAKEESNRGSRHYGCMDIDGDDLVIVSRSGDKNAQSAHNGNLITFHRVKNFRDLVY